MAEKILNLLPLTREQKTAFETTAPNFSHNYARRSQVTAAMLEECTTIFGAPIPEQLCHAKQLKWLQSMWAGGDEYQEEGILPVGTMLTTAVGANDQAVAEHMLAMLLSLCKRLPQYRDRQTQEVWKDCGDVKSIRGATILIVGAGSIGSYFAGLCKALGAYTIGLRRDVSKPTEGVDELYPISELEHCLPRADVVAMTLPHAAETVGLMNAARFEMMKAESIFINAGRGSAVDLDALYTALMTGKLWAAGLDVTEPEPLPAQHPLWHMENVLLTPHIAGGLHLPGVLENIIAICQENLRRYVAREPLKNRLG